MAGPYDDIVAGMSAPQAPSASPYDLAVRQLQDDDQQAHSRAALAVGLSATTNPDQAALHNALAQRYNTTPEVVAAYPQEFKDRMALELARSNMQDAPGLQKYIANQPQTAAIIHDDIPNAAAVEKTVTVGGAARSAMEAAFPAVGLAAPENLYEGVKGLGGAFNKAAGGVNMLLGAFPAAYDTLTGGNAADTWFRSHVDPMLANQPAFAPATNAPFMAKAANMGGNLLGMLAQITLSGTTAAAPEAGAIAAPGTVGQTLGAAVEHGAKSMAFPALSDAVDTGRSIYLATGNAALAAKAASVSYLTSTMQGIVPLSAPGNAASRVMSGFLSGGAMSEVQRQATNAVLPENMAQPFDAEQAILSALAGSVLAVGGPRGERPGYVDAVRDTYRQAEQADAANDAFQRMSKLGELSAQSKWRERDPEGFQQFVRSVTEDGDMPAVYIEGKAFAQGLQKAGIAPEELAQQLPEVAGQLREAQLTDGFLRIATADYAGLIAGTPLDKAILPELRADPQGMNFREAQAFYQDAAQRMQQQAGEIVKGQQEQDAFRESQGRAVQGLQDQLDALGRFSPDVNRVYANVHGAILSRLAAHEGISPEQAAAKYGPRVVGESVGAALAQEEGQRGAFAPDANAIALLKNADLSTYLHETGHWALDTYAKIATAPDAPPEIRADLDKVLKSFGVESLEKWNGMSLDEQRPHHEQFARQFESYLMEGKAPSRELQPFFQRIRSWMVNIYRALKGLGVQLSPEVRQVFDRMLASDEAIREAQAQRVFEPLLTQKPAGVSAEDWARYQDMGAEATNEAIEAMQGKSLRDMKWLSGAKSRAVKDLQKQAKQARDSIQREVEEQVGDMPVYRLQDFLKGKKLDKLDSQELAEMFGFKGGDEMLRELAEAPPRKEVISGLVDRYMIERHGELSSPDAIDAAASDAVHNDARARFMATGLKILTKSPIPVSELVRGAKEAAASAIGEQRVRDLSTRQYEAAETKSNRDAIGKVAKDPLGAAQAQRAAILNNQLVKAAREAMLDVQKGLDYFKRFTKDSVREKVQGEFRDQIDALLARYDLRTGLTPEQASEKNMMSLESFVEKLSAMKFAIDVPEAMITNANRMHYKDMTVTEFRGLVDAVKSIEHLGREVQKVQDGNESRLLKEVAAEAVEQLQKLPQRKAETNRGLSRIEEKWLGFKSFARSVQASLLKMEQMVDWLDNYDPKGVFNRLVFRKIADAEGRRNDLDLKISKAWEKAVGEIPADVLKDGRRVYEVPGVIDNLTGQPQRLTWNEKIALAGIRGDAEHFSKLLKGEKWDAAAVLDFLDRNMSKAEWDFVQKIAGTFQELFPLKQQMLREMGSSAPKEVPRIAFQTTDGERPGWYWPISYDPARSNSVRERYAKHEASLFEDNIYSRADTSTGREQTRNDNYAKPMLLSIDMLPRVLKDEVRDITTRRAILEADRFLRQPDVRRGVVGALSQEHYDQFNGWLQSLANDAAVKPSELQMWDRVMHEIRTRATMVGLGFRISTMVMHGMTAAGESVAEAGFKTMAKGVFNKKTWAGVVKQLGPEWLDKGLQSFSRDGQWEANGNFITERSAEMRHRVNEIERDVREQLREIHLQLADPATGTLARAKLAVEQRAYQGIAMLDYASAMPTWMGAYLKGMTPAERGGLGMSEKDAVYFADKTVRNAHGGGGVKDMAAIQRGNEFQKLFTMFYTFWNHNINRIMDTAKRVKELPGGFADAKQSGDWAGFRGDVGNLVLRSFMYTMGVQAIHHMVHPPKDEDGEEGWLKWMAKAMALSAAGGVPIARDIASHYVGGKDYEMSPATSVINNTDRLLADLKDGSTHERWIKHAMTEAGYILGMPLGQPGSTAQFLADVWNGKQHPEDIAEWWRGVTTGDMQKH